MGLTRDIIPVFNELIAIGFPFLLVFDRHDPEEKKYIKIVYFLLGCMSIFEIYRYSNIGSVIDDLLESKIFSTPL
jgi:hypothetical protein